jgi:hypothetical protein
VKAVTPGSHELTVTVTDSKVDAEITVTIDVTAADGTADTVVDAEIMVTITVTDD